MMDNNPSNEGHPESTNTEDNEHAENVEMPSHTDESLPAIPSSAPATPKADKTPKITVVLCPVGGAPIMRQRKWEVDCTQTIGFIASFIRKKLTLQKSDSLVMVLLRQPVLRTCSRPISPESFRLLSLGRFHMEFLNGMQMPHCG